jgi:hypothetical protein
MRRWLTSIVLTAVIAVAVGVALAGCGSQKRTIPTKTGQSLLGQLDTIQSQYDNGSCSGTRAKANTLVGEMRKLPSSVDPEVKKNLIAGAQRLGQLVQDCKPAQPTNTTPTTVPTAPTQTVPTQTVPTQTVPTNTVPTNTAPTGPTTTPNTAPTTPGGGGGVSVPGGGIGGGTP